MPAARRWADSLAASTGPPVAEKRPLSDPGVLRRGAPFAGVAFVAVAVEALTATSSSNLPVLVAVVLTVGALLTAAWVVPWRRLPAWSEALVPLGFFVVVALMNHARGAAATGYPPLVMLPIIWLALYGTRGQLRVAIVATAATLLTPLVLAGSQIYPTSTWGLSVLALAVGAVGGPAVQRLVDESHQRAADVAAVGAITRALTAGADPRPELCAAAAAVAGAGFAVLFEPDDDGVLVATAGTDGLDLDELRVDPQTETAATAQVWRTGRRLYLADVRTDPRASPRLTALTGAVAVLFQPITRDGRRTAVLIVGFPDVRAHLPQAALDLVELVAAEIAAAIDRADLVALMAAQARTDALTGAANRRSWDEALDRELARAVRTGDPLTVALLDMDHFKAYNDSFGHNAGDALLRDLVQALRTELRTGDVIARWGGEEFALALPVCDMAQAQVIAARLLALVPSGQTVSIGLTQAGPGDTPRSLVGRADRALYLAKDGGRNRIGALPAPALPGEIDRAAS
ncbi:GGDEF domain-containing protein [Pengzhenrongella frigida]|uniref:GGDEF domain-containing protein n=1 Tax=Pengzhenrongella frigida TaxID=1259133 RepID=A0A4Q5MW46_9MICO|nr:sensor domain-containing diguanylate cyclase [Cellulomonas sp. HLT2-17]RYV49816.1 GGDEF domain-containing protein [Cellulomonas sp. HLT2-17]